MPATLVINAGELRSRRLLAGLTQAALAAKVGVHPITLVRYETGKMQPRPDTAQRIARALGVEISDLVTITDAS